MSEKPTDLNPQTAVKGGFFMLKNKKGEKIMWKTAEELLSPIEHDVDYLENCLYNTDNIFKITIGQEIGENAFNIYFFTPDNKKITFAVFSYDNSNVGEARNAFSRSEHYFKNIYKNLKE